MDVYTGFGWTTASISLIVGIAGLVWLRAFRNIVGHPLVIIVDDPEEYFTLPTMFRTSVIYIPMLYLFKQTILIHFAFHLHMKGLESASLVHLGLPV